ncbi:MAG: hypothetical protein KDB45_16275, partial [Mycobacterium sp.]|nr:hypothetical protein [Mycobacterium sp.]
GVIPALSEAASDIALALIGGEDLTTALAAAAAALKANPDIDAAIGVAVGDAVTELLSDATLWQAVDATAISLITGLLADPTVQNALQQEITDQVSKLLGGGELGQVVGTQVAAAVVGLLTNPVVSTALVGLVDTVTQDFFGAPGVIPALSEAASDIALALIGGEDLTT